MNARERWTVYPLLFLTLGLVMRDRVEQQDMQSQQRAVENSERSISVNRLIILDEDKNVAYSLTEKGWEPKPPGEAIGRLTIEEFLRRMQEKKPVEGFRNQ